VADPVFLAGVDTEKFGRSKIELNNAYVAGQTNYPKMVTFADLYIEIMQIGRLADIHFGEFLAR
jgi:hypothetical protein